MAVAISTIRANIYTILSTHLQTGTYAITSNNIHPSYNDQQFRSEGVPQVVISDIIAPEDKITFGRKGLYEVYISFTIHAFHNSAQNVRTLADEICSKLRGAGKVFIESQGIKKPKLSSENDNQIPWTQKKTTYIKELTYTARYVSTV